ncbi:hypothetical protein B484DRAFT_411430 [Ochromonadaceae sp. CCMP2298]|nr:hypothetical protein B484DRAFT_411430 [Ochromonadaceae sp. CCMP2298]
MCLTHLLISDTPLLRLGLRWRLRHGIIFLRHNGGFRICQLICHSLILSCTSKLCRHSLYPFTYLLYQESTFSLCMQTLRVSCCQAIVEIAIAANFGVILGVVQSPSFQ